MEVTTPPIYVQKTHKGTGKATYEDIIAYVLEKHGISVNAISKCRFSPKWDVVFYRAAYRCYTALYTTSLAGLKPVKP